MRRGHAGGVGVSNVRQGRGGLREGEQVAVCGGLVGPQEGYAAQPTRALRFHVPLRGRRYELDGGNDAAGRRG